MFKLSGSFASRAELDKAQKTSITLQKEINSATLFVKQIEQGELNITYPGVDEDSIDPMSLPGSLISMRNQLKQLNKTETQRKWVTEGLALFSEILRTNQHDLDETCFQSISNLVKYLKANQGAIYIVDKEKELLEQKACYAYDRKKYLEKTFSFGEGMIGQIYLEKETLLLLDVPENYVTITSGLGEAPPNSIVIVPLKINEDVLGIVELASFKKFESYQIEFLEKLGENIASVISTVQTNEKTQELLRQSQIQAESLKSQEEELRQNMEELSATQEEMQRVMKEIQDKEQLLNDLINSTPDVVFVIDHEYKFKMFNKAFYKNWTEYKHDLQVGDSLLDSYKNATALEVDKQKQLWDRALSGEFISQSESTIIRGETKYMQVIYSPLRDKNNNISGIAIFSKDVTEQEEAIQNSEKLLWESQQQAEQMKAQEETILQSMEELSSTQEELLSKQKEASDLIERFNLAAKTTTEGLWDMVVPSDLNIDDNTPFIWTDNFREMLGYKSEEDFPNVLHSWSDLLHPDDKQRTIDAFNKHLLDYSGNTIYDVEYKLKLIDGTYRWFRAVGNTLRDKDGKPIRIAGSLIDIQAIKDTEELKKQLEEKVKFQASVSTDNDSVFLENLINAAPDEIFTLDRDYNLISYNERFYKLWRSEGFEIKTGINMSLFFDDVEEWEHHKEFYKSAFNGENFSVNLSRNVAGEERFYNVVYSPVRSANEEEIIAIALFARPLTEANTPKTLIM
ncbi:PAS domain S-box protein [Chondrinema litorale]|uniref:PAS domain S-box protein n=1 Tax=Chondrinema litorale TaxID=2994555 RepID=UPI002543479B|nr:PAS domain S-box protein [Chondrinema litorale]UZR97531.1 PAS domain S-box protein [Chondrinema litorale]